MAKGSLVLPLIECGRHVLRLAKCDLNGSCVVDCAGVRSGLRCVPLRQQAARKLCSPFKGLAFQYAERRFIFVLPDVSGNRSTHGSTGHVAENSNFFVIRLDDLPHQDASARSLYPPKLFYFPAAVRKAVGVWAVCCWMNRVKYAAEPKPRCRATS